MAILVNSMKQLAIALQSMHDFSNPKSNLEQYRTDPDLASRLLWDAYMQGWIEGKHVLDLGSGPGSLGFGAIFLGADKLDAIEIDPDASTIWNQNKKDLQESIDSEAIASATLHIDSIHQWPNIDGKIDTIIMNPPFGVQTEKLDSQFLIAAMQHANNIATIHGEQSQDRIARLAQEHGFIVKHQIEDQMMLQATMKHHKKQRMQTNVVRYLITKL